MQCNFFLHVFVWCQLHCPNICFWALNQVWLNVACKFPLKRDQTNTHQSWAFWLLAVKWSVCCESRRFVEYSRGEDAGQFSMIKVHRWTSSPSILRNVSLSPRSLSLRVVPEAVSELRGAFVTAAYPPFPAASWTQVASHTTGHQITTLFLSDSLESERERERLSPSESDPTPSQCASLSFLPFWINAFS